jgi:hypothetical protein
MPRSYASTVIDAPADEVWARVRDFNGLATFTLTDGTHLRERLLSHSDVEREYSYNFEKTPFDVDNYHATIRVTPVTDGNKSFVEWWTTFDCDRDQQDHWTEFFATQVFQGGFDALHAHFGNA